MPEQQPPVWAAPAVSLAGRAGAGWKAGGAVQYAVGFMA